MTQERFNVFAIGTRLSVARAFAHEISYWSDTEERVLGLVFMDRTDSDFGWMLLARDRIGRFRCVGVEASLKSESYAARGLRERIARAVKEDDLIALGFQDDETNYATDLLGIPADTKLETLHPSFRSLFQDSGRSPARAVLREIGNWLAPSDPHFVQEFQFKQFDQRLWELYLWAALRELDFDVTQPEAPDFLCRAPGIEFTVEATTVKASESGPLAKHPEPTTLEEMRAFLTDYMPMKFGSSLTSKLMKKNASGESYWERGESPGKPFILAIADFHKPGSESEIGSMTYTVSALWPYLYGHRVEWEKVDGKLVVRAVKGSDHAYGGKVVPTGFFDLPGAENVSAVIFSNAGTIAKFDRIGVAAGFGLPGHHYVRSGIRYDPDPDAVEGVPFVEEIKPGHSERWSDELQVFHNPRAKHPLPIDVFDGITQHFFQNGDQYSLTPEGAVISSWTTIIQLKD